MLAFANFAREANEKGLDHSKPLSIPLGVLTPLNNLAGVIISDMVAGIDETHEAVFQQELAKAKEEGLEAVKSLVSYNDFGYEMEEISTITANSLLKGEFVDYSKFKDEDASNKLEEINELITVLVRKLKHPISGQEIFQIETFFIKK